MTTMRQDRSDINIAEVLEAIRIFGKATVKDIATAINKDANDPRITGVVQSRLNKLMKDKLIVRVWNSGWFIYSPVIPTTQEEPAPIVESPLRILLVKIHTMIGEAITLVDQNGAEQAKIAKIKALLYETEKETP